MKEYWVNVYEDHKCGHLWDDKFDAIIAGKSSKLRKRFRGRVIYRIHVKLKDEKR